MPIHNPLRPYQDGEYRFIKYFRKSQETFGGSRKEIKNRSGLADSQTTVSRILDGTAPLTIARAKKQTISAAKDSGFAWLPLWTYLSADQPDPATQFSEIELATIDPADPLHAKGIAYVFRRHQRQARQIVWYSDSLPLALVPRPYIRRKIELSWPILPDSKACSVMRFERRLAQLQHTQLIEDCGTDQRILVPIFRDRFELLAHKKPPFGTLTPSEVRECIEWLAFDLPERNILVVLVEKILCPGTLRKHLSRFRGILAVGRTLLLREACRFPGRLRYERTTDAAVNAHIELEIARLEELIQHRNHDLSPTAVTAQMMKYL